MKIVGLIAEYNPFHNGHEYHIRKAKEISGADAVVVVMSGNFVQRGEPAILPKHLRAQMALQAGASLVIELPVCYATGSAEQFAYGSVSLLERLGCVDALCFGSECGDLESLQKIAKILADEPEQFRFCLQAHLKNGLSFPLAREKALEEVYPFDSFSTLLKEPNNILAIEYLKALEKLKSSMVPYTVKRTHANYHDEALTETFSSATAIRAAIANEDLEVLKSHVPSYAWHILKDLYQKRYPVTADDFSMLLKYRLLNETKETLIAYADVSEELANRIIHSRNQFRSFRQFCDLLKTKEITYARISRALLHILLRIRKEDCREISYAHVLGFRKDMTSVMTAMKQTGNIPLVTKLTGLTDPMLDSDIAASDLYESMITDLYHTAFINEYEHPVVRI